MLESLVSNYCVFFRDSQMEFGWIEGTQKNKVIVVPINGKNQFLAENRIAFSWKDKKLPLNSTMAHKAKKFMEDCEIQIMHSLLDEIREYSIDELADNFLENPQNTIHRLGLFLSLRKNSFWFKHNRNLTYTPRTKKELEYTQNLSRRQDKYFAGLNKIRTEFNAKISKVNKKIRAYQYGQKKIRLGLVDEKFKKMDFKQKSKISLYIKLYGSCEKEHKELPKQFLMK